MIIHFSKIVKNLSFTWFRFAAWLYMSGTFGSGYKTSAGKQESKIYCLFILKL